MWNNQWGFWDFPLVWDYFYAGKGDLTQFWSFYTEISSKLTEILISPILCPINKVYSYYSFNLFGRSNLWGRFTFVALCWRLQPTMKHLALLPEAPGSVACAPLLPEEPVKHLVLFIATCISSRVWQVFEWYRLFIFLGLSSCIGFVLIRKWSQVISPYFGVFTTIKV